MPVILHWQFLPLDQYVMLPRSLLLSYILYSSLKWCYCYLFSQIYRRKAVVILWAWNILINQYLLLLDDLFVYSPNEFTGNHSLNFTACLTKDYQHQNGRFKIWYWFDSIKAWNTMKPFLYWQFKLVPSIIIQTLLQKESTNLKRCRNRKSKENSDGIIKAYKRIFMRFSKEIFSRVLLEWAEIQESTTFLLPCRLDLFLCSYSCL